MSLDYDFEIETNLSLKEIAEIVAQPHKAEVDENYDFDTKGFCAGVRVKEIQFEETKIQYLNGYRFIPNIRIGFTQIVRDGFELSQQNIAKSVAALLTKSNDKVVFMFGYYKTIAQRLEGAVIEVHEAGDESYPDYYDWLVNEFDKVGLNYVRKVLRSPLQE